MRRLSLLLYLLAVAACEPRGGETDGDGDADGDGDTCPSGAECCADRECSNGVYCDGVERCDGGRCEPATVIPCDDGRECTRDECDEGANLCVFLADDSLCDDGDSCTGVERCVPADDEADERGCIADMPRACDDGDECTDDFCADGECQVRIRDRDGDGHADRGCVVCDGAGSCERGDDCDDLDPSVFPGAEEVCDDGRDNDCDRARDYAEAGCTVPNDTCGTAVDLVEGGWVHSSTRGTTADIDGACGLPSDRDVAFSFSLSVPHDVLIELDSLGGSDLHVGVTSECGSAEASLGCAEGRDFSVRARDLEAGRYFVVVSSPSDADFALRLTTTPAIARPAGDLCADAIAIAGDGAPVAGSLAGAAHDEPLDCARGAGPTRDVVYTFDAGTELTADLTVTRNSGSGPIYLAVQGACGVSSAARACWSGDGAAGGRLWRLTPGTYHVVVAHADEVSFDLEVSLSPVDSALVFFEDFTEGASGWTLTGDWERGTPTTFVEPDGRSGPCVATNVGGDYPDSMMYTTDFAQSPGVDLRGARAPLLTFSSWLRASIWEGDAGFRVEVSADGGAFAAARDVVPTYDGLGGWNGEHGVWETWQVDLSSLAGAVVTIRFAAQSAPTAWDHGAGWYVDDVVIIDR